MAYIQSELEQAVELLEPRLASQVTTTGIWFEELQKALMPLRYLRDQSDLDTVGVDGYLAVFLSHVDSLLAEAWRRGWTNHSRKQED